MTEIQQQWVKALRSGEYKQGRNALRIDDEFCCLGVLCDLAVKAGVAQCERNSQGENDDKPSYQYRDFDSTGRQSSATYLPTCVREWVGLYSNVGDWSTRWDEDCLVNMNDEGVPFPLIADFIEATQGKLFVKEVV